MTNTMQLDQDLARCLTERSIELRTQIMAVSQQDESELYDALWRQFVRVETDINTLLRIWRP